jgi:excisionase family DNA binding protein
VEKLLTVEEAAALLSVRPRSVYEMTSRRGRERREHPLPVIRLNAKCLRFRRQDLEAWVAEQVTHE